MTMTEPSAELALRAQPVLPMTAQEAQGMMTAYQELTRSLLGPEDMQRVDDKEFVKRSGFQKLSAAYGVSTEILMSTTETVVRGDETVLVSRVVARAVHPSGRHADGDGVCASNEKRFRKGDQRMEHNLQATATTRAVNRAVSNLIAFGSISAEEAMETAPVSAQRPDWAQPMNDIGGVAHNITRVLKAAGIQDASKVKEIGNTIFKLCDGEFPFVAARLAGLLASAVEEGPTSDLDPEDDAAKTVQEQLGEDIETVDAEASESE